MEPDVHGSGAENHHDDHPPFLAHHFRDAKQQYEAGKLGMWLFLATELLLFGGLFCLYAVFRFNRPEIFEYGSQFLDTRWGAINTVVLIASSVTMAAAVWAAQVGKTRVLVTLLSLTFLGGVGFMSIKYVEYRHKFHEHLVWGTTFYEPVERHGDEHGEHGEMAAEGEDEQLVVKGDPVIGNTLFQETCRACHGVAGEGIPGQGKDQRGSEFIANATDDELVAFLKVGRMPSDPGNTTGIQMPPKGGNPLLKDEDLYHLIAYVRTFPPPPEGGEEAGDEAPDDAIADAATPQEFWIPRSSIPNAPSGPAGLVHPVALDQLVEEAHEEAPMDHAGDPNRPDNAHVFFGIYFVMTGLHGLHVLVGMGVIAWLILRSLRGHFGPAYYTPIDLGGLYWHIVDLIWIFLFPLLYLIA